MKKQQLKPGIYQHYKGMLYRVIGVAKHTETDEEMVMYKLLYENDWSRYAVRSLKEFTEKVKVKGKLIPRFKFIGTKRKGKLKT